MTLNLVATRRVKYPAGSGGTEYDVGQPFKALSEKDAKVLVAVGRAKYAEQAINKTNLPKRQILTTAVKPADPLAEAPQPGRKTYSRRDLTPEE